MGAGVMRQMERNGEHANKLIATLYYRLMNTRANEITRLKEERLARQLRDREEGIRRISMRRKEIHSRFERFISSCVQESLQRARGMK